MNHRIEELLEQCTIHWVDNTQTYDHEKFAELIVKECIDIVTDVLPSVCQESKYGIHPVWHIKEHFGIKS